MEKKAYISPAINIVEVMVCQLLANSLNSTKNLDGVSKSSEKFSGGTADTKSSGSWNVWGDDDE